MRHRLILIFALPFLSGCTTINLTQPGADDLYWSKNDAVNEPLSQSAPPIESYTDDYWEEGNQTNATTESGDVIIHNYDGYDNSGNINSGGGWAGWDPYWGWGFGVGWYRPQFYSNWNNWNFCFGNNWYSPYWYHNPWVYGGWGYPVNCSPWNYPFGYFGNGYYGSPVIWGNGVASDGNSIGGFYYGPFTPLSTNSGSNSSYNSQGQHLGKISNTDDTNPSTGIGKKPIGPINYVEKIIIPETLTENTDANPDSPARSFMNIPTGKPASNSNVSKPTFNPSTQGKQPSDKINLPPVKPSKGSFKPKFESPSQPPSPSPSAFPSPGRSSSPVPAGGNSGRNSGGGGNGGGGRPPRN